MKVINTKGIIILAVVLLVIQLGVGLVLSPLVGKIVIEQLNKYGGTKIDVGSVNVWPLTFSCSLKDLKIFDPDNEKQRIALVRKASVGINPLALLSKRLVVSNLVVTGAEINLKGEPDGSFNIQKLARGEDSKKEAAQKGSVFDRFKKGKDLFTRVYDMVKNNASKKAAEKNIKEHKESTKVKREVVELPKGRRVNFTTLSDEYVFQIKNFAVKNAKIKVETQDGQSLEVEKGDITISNLGIDPKKGARFDKISIAGGLIKEGENAGSFDMDYRKTFSRDTQKTAISFSARGVDLSAVSFVYQDSLPVDFSKGIIDVSSKTNILNGDLSSSNSIILKGQKVSPKSGQQTAMVGMIPLSTICEALNQIDPVNLKFEIGGTVENPQLKNFQDTLLQLVKPYLSNITKTLKEQGVKALGGLLNKETPAEGGSTAAATDDTTSKAADAIKSFFGGSGEK